MAGLRIKLLRFTRKGLLIVIVTNESVNAAYTFYQMETLASAVNVFT